jgi:hypothetical protein
VPDVVAPGTVRVAPSRLKAELEQAQQQLSGATPQDKEEARKHFLDALHNFSLLVLHGQTPLTLVRK